MFSKYQPESLQNYKYQTSLWVFCREFCTEIQHSLRHTKKYLKLALIIWYCSRWSVLTAKTKNSLKIDVFEGKIFREFPQNLENWRCTNADLKIYRYLCLSLKIILRKFRIKTAFTFWVMRTQDIWNVCLQTYRDNRIC